MIEKAHVENRQFSENPLLSRKEIYQDPTYITLYRYENKDVPHDESREGIVSKKTLLGAWFCDSVDDLKTYFIQRIQGQPGGLFIQDMDIEAGNYLIPAEIIAETGLYIEAPFKDEWKGKKNVPMKEWRFITDVVESMLNDQALRFLAEIRTT